MEGEEQKGKVAAEDDAAEAQAFLRTVARTCRKSPRLALWLHTTLPWTVKLPATNWSCSKRTLPPYRFGIPVPDLSPKMEKPSIIGGDQDNL